MSHSIEHPSRRELLGLAVGAATVGALAASAPARAGSNGINSLIAVTQQKVAEAAAAAAALEGADKQRADKQRALLTNREGEFSEMRELDARRVRSQAVLNAHLQEIADNLARMRESSRVC